MKMWKMLLISAVLLAFASVPAAARHRHSKKCYQRGGHAYVSVAFQFGQRSYRDRDYRDRRRSRDYDRRNRYYDSRYSRRSYRRNPYYCPRY